MTYQYLVVCDTNNIASYMFSNPKYKFIRGASALLDSLNLQETRNIAGQNNGTILSVGGGESRILFHSLQDAEAFESTLRQKYRELTDEVTLTLAVVERESNEKMEDWLERAELQLRIREKESDKKLMPFLPLYPLVVRCEGCYKRPAEEYYHMSEGNKKLCLSCFKKASHVDQLILKLSSAGQNQELQEISGLMEIHQHLLQSKSGSSWTRKVTDVLQNEQGSQGYVGFVYADGKKLGSFFRKTVLNQLKGEDDDVFVHSYQSFSQTVHNSIIQAVLDTSLRFKDHVIDYAMVGGDDFVAVMPGEIAVIYTNELIKQFEAHTKRAFTTILGKVNGGVTMGAGVVIANVGFPLYRLFQLSYDLMSQAKQKYSDQGVLDYLIITDSTVQTVSTIKKYENLSIDTNEVLKDKSVRMNGFMVDSQNGNHPESIDQLISVIKQLKQAGFPRSKVKAIYELVRKSNDFQARFEWLKWRARLPKNVKATLDQWSTSFKETPFIFTNGRVAYTPLLDLFDLYDFVTLEEKNNESENIN